MTTQRNTAVRRLNRAIDRFQETDWHGSHFGQLGQLADLLDQLATEIETHIDKVVSEAGGQLAEQLIAELTGDE